MLRRHHEPSSTWSWPMQPATIEKVGESSQLTSRQPFSKGNSFKEENGNFVSPMSKLALVKQFSLCPWLHRTAPKRHLWFEWFTTPLVSSSQQSFDWAWLESIGVGLRLLIPLEPRWRAWRSTSRVPFGSTWQAVRFWFTWGRSFSVLRKVCGAAFWWLHNCLHAGVPHQHVTCSCPSPSEERSQQWFDPCRNETAVWLARFLAAVGDASSRWSGLCTFSSAEREAEDQHLVEGECLGSSFQGALKFPAPFQTIWSRRCRCDGCHRCVPWKRASRWQPRRRTLGACLFTACIHGFPWRKEVDQWSDWQICDDWLYRSHRIGRVCRSTYGAELLVAEEGFDVGQFVRALAAEFRGLQVLGKLGERLAKGVEMTVVTDAKDIYDRCSSDTSTYGSQKSLAFTVAWLRAILQKPNTTLRWTSTQNMLADCGTKEMEVEHLHCILKDWEWSASYDASFVKQGKSKAVKKVKQSAHVTLPGEEMKTSGPTLRHVMQLGDVSGWHNKKDFIVQVARNARSYRTPMPRFKMSAYPLRSTFGRFDSETGSSWWWLETDVEYGNLPNAQSMLDFQAAILISISKGQGQQEKSTCCESFDWPWPGHFALIMYFTHGRHVAWISGLDPKYAGFDGKTGRLVTDWLHHHNVFTCHFV